MDEQTRAFLVEERAQIEVLKSATVLLMAQLLRPLEPAEREDVLTTFMAVASDVPLDTATSTPENSRIFEAIAAAIPQLAELFSDNVREALQ